MSPTHSPVDHQNMQSLQVITDPETAATIYNGELKVLVSALDREAIDHHLQLPAMIALHVCDRSGRDRRFDIFRAARRRGLTRVPLPHPPTFCLALLATSPAGKKELEILREVWAGGSEGFLPSPIMIDLAGDADTAALAAYGILFDAVVGMATSSSARLLVLQRQFTSFRIAHDQLQNAFDTVENFLARSNLPSTWLAFACDPTETSTGPQTGEDAFRLRQALPVPSQGLAAIELHATIVDPGADGSLSVSIETCEDGRILGEWAIPYDAVPEGWMFLDLPEIDIAPRQSVRLNASWKTQRGTPPRLSLTQLQPLPESRVRIIGGSGDSDRSLALRLHIGLPGSRRVAHPFHIGIKRQSPVGRLGQRLAPSVLRRCAEVTPAANGEPLVSFVEEIEAIKVRPVNGGITVAKLPGALPPEARRLSATIKTEDPAGPLVEYALLALDPGDPHEPILNDGLAEGQRGGFSGWQPIHPDFATQIHLSMAGPAAKPLDLYLATRLAPGQNAESAEARWLEFVVDAGQEASLA